MAPKVFPYNFESFQGLDYKNSSLKGSILTAEVAQNLQFSEGYSLKGRPGSQLIAQPGGFLGIGRYYYDNIQTLAQTEEIIAINDQLWKLAYHTQTITRSSGARWGHKFYHAAGTGGSVYFDLTQISGGQILNVDLGNGLEEVPYTVYDLLLAIDALANYSTTFNFEYAKVNGDQSSVNTITVDAGHSYAANDRIEFFDFPSLKLTSRRVTGTAATTVTVDGAAVTVKDNQVLGKIAGVPAAAIPITALDTTVIDINGTTQDFLFYYWEPIRETVSDTISIGKSYRPFQNFFSNSAGVAWKPPCMISAQNDLFIATEVPNATVYEWENRPFKYDGQVCYRAGLHRPYFVQGAAGSAGALTGVYKWKVQYEMRDAQGVIHLSQPSQEIPGQETTLASEMGDVTIYQVQTDFGTEKFADIDKLGRLSVTATVNGNQAGVNTIVVGAQNSFKENDTIYLFDGITSFPSMRRVTAATQLSITVDGAAVTVSDLDVLYHGYAGYNIKFAIVNGNQNNVSTVTVDTGHNLVAGDSIFIRGDDGAGAIKYHDIILSSVTATTLVWDADTYGTVYVRDNQIVSCGLKIHLYRTKANGSIYYEADILPNSLADFFIVHSDNRADTALGAELIEPEIGKEWDPPPRAGIISEHQGAFVYSRIRGDSNSIGFSDEVGGLESVPLASNYFSVPSTIGGGITATASDDADSLFVAKDRAIYRVDGTLQTNSFSLVKVKEGDYGISSHASVAKVNGVIIGVGPLGFVAISGGKVIESERGGSLYGQAINPAILNNTNLRLSQAVGFNDSSARHYHCFIPDIDGNATGETQANSLFFVLDYENRNIWFTNLMDPAVKPSGGFTQGAIGPVNQPISDLLASGTKVHHSYHLSKAYNSTTLPTGGNIGPGMPGCLFRQFSSLYKDTYSEMMIYIDHVFPTQYKLRTKQESLQDPESEKEFSRFKIWSLPGDYESRVPFNATIKSYKNFQSSTRDSEFILSFNAATDTNKSKELAVNKCQSMAFEITVEAYRESPFITGISIAGSLPYRKEDIKK